MYTWGGVFKSNVVRLMHALCIICIFSMPSYATTWVFLRSTDKYAKHAYDKERLRIEGASLIFWRQVKFLKPQPSDFGEVSRSIYHERLDCQSQTVQTLFIGLYDSENRRLFEQRMPESSAPTLILPESIGELFQTYLCRLVPLGDGNLKSEGFKKNGKQPIEHTTDKFVPQRRPVVETQPSSHSPSAPINVPVAPIPPVAPAPLSLPAIPPVTVPPIVPPLLPFVEP